MPERHNKSTPYTPISREDLVAQLEAVAQRVFDPVAGMYGPDSMVWNVNRHSTVFFGAGRANALQLAHPWVANSIQQHSAALSDPLGRLRRTFINVFAMVYGDLEQVTTSALKVHEIHRKVTGKLSEKSGGFDANSRYMANEVQSMIWVHATLWETSMMMFEMFQHSLSKTEKDRYYQETRLFAWLFGIPDAALPKTWDEFVEYNRSMWESDQLAVGEVGREVMGFIFNMGGLLRPFVKRHKLHTSMMMPERLRAEFGWHTPTSREQRAFNRDVRIIKRVMPMMPAHIRYLPPYLEALGRLKGREQASPVTRLANRVILGQARLVS